MTFTKLRNEYAAGGTPTEVIARIYDRIEAAPLAPVWIAIVPREAALQRARELEAGDKTLPLFGIPFAVKDNIDVEGLPTTAACPAYAYAPDSTATVVARLLEAGAMLIGKTNMDQFATGLVGTRSPHGACSSVFDERYISGGSSSGSAIAVASGLVAFSLGTDTAGSGRVPAAFNNLVGLKPTRGLLSTNGIVPACRTLDCVSIFAANCEDARDALAIARGFDQQDPYSRTAGPGDGAAPWLGGKFRFGVPPEDQLEFFGDQEAKALYFAAIDRLSQMGGDKVEIEFSVFRQAADLLYSGPWVSERTAALGEFLHTDGSEMDPTVHKIIFGGLKHSAVDSFKAQYKLEELRRAASAEWARMDVLVLPTTGTTYTIAEVEKEPIRLNTNLGYYTNFVNLLDLAAVAVPAGFRPNKLPFGITLMGPAFSDEALLALAQSFEGSAEKPKATNGCVAVAVVGAHLSGQPLNWQLTQRAGRLAKSTRTSAEYRLYALPGTVPPKPGMVREIGFEGPGIEVEVWNVPEDQFGGFVAAVPNPLSIGDVQLEDKSWVKCFLCESAALAGAREITSFGGWRGYLAEGRSN